MSILTTILLSAVPYIDHRTVIIVHLRGVIEIAEYHGTCFEGIAIKPKSFIGTL